MVQTQGEQTIQLEDAIYAFGQPTLLSRQEAVNAFNTRNHGLVCLILDDEMMDKYRAYIDDPEAYQKGTDEEPPTEEYQWMVPGWHSVNVLDRYLFPIPLPQNIRIVGIDYSLLEGVPDNLRLKVVA